MIGCVTNSDIAEMLSMGGLEINHRMIRPTHIRVTGTFAVEVRWKDGRDHHYGYPKIIIEALSSNHEEKSNE